MRFDTYKMEDALASLIDYRGKTPHKSDVGVMTLSAKSVRDGYIDYSQCYFISEDEYKKFMVRGFPKVGDVLLTTEAPLGVVARLDRDDIAIAQRILTLRGKEGILDTGYLYYYLRSSIGQAKLREKESGTTVTGIKQAEFRKIKIDIPCIAIQRKIASIMEVLDKKIKLNNEINENLEQQAMALFKWWFIDYEPFDRQVPTTWKNGVLGDFVEIKRGGSPRPIQNFLSDSGLHWLKISDATNISSPFINEIKEYIIEDGLKKTVFLKAGSLVLSNSATPGLPKILDIDTCIHDGWLYFPSSKFSNEYLYLYFKHIRDNLIALGNGSVFTNLKTDILKNYPTNLPTDEVLNEFDGIIKPIFSMILSKTRESKRLTEIRDSLLPRLMSGELDVSTLDI